MTANIHFHTADLERIFSIIGSADRNVLLQIGVRPGEEFRAPLEEEEDDYLESDEDEDKDEDEEEELEEDDEAEEAQEEWDYEGEEEVSAREVLTKVVMAGVPPDLAENEASAIQEFFASYATSSGLAHLVDADDVVEAADAEDDPDLAEAIRSRFLEGVSSDEMAEFVEWLQEGSASSELTARVQMLCCGRLPESEEPTFVDPDEVYAARSGYLFQEEIAQVSDELGDLAVDAAESVGPLPRVLAGLFHFCNINSRDLFVTIEE